MKIETIAKNNAILIPEEKMTIHLHWEKTADFDIFAIYETMEGTKELLYFANSGSQEEPPFLELLFDFEFSEIPTDNQEIIALQKMEQRQIWFFAWDFDAVQEGEKVNFSEQKVFLEFRGKECFWQTLSADLGEGNLALLASIQKQEDGLLLYNHSEMRLQELPEQMEELLKEIQLP